MTPRQQRHPAEQIGVILADGRRASVRPSLAQDIDLLRASFALSTNIDQVRHVVLLAYATNAVSQSMVGEARYILSTDEAGSTEFALRWPLTGKD